MTVSSAHNILCGPHRDSINQATRPKWFFTRLQGSIYPADGTETERVNFMCHPDWPQGAHTKPCFWMPLRGRFQKGLAFQSMDSIDCPLQCVWASSSLCTTWIQEKVEGGIHFFFPPHCLSHISFSLLLRPWDSGLNYTQAPAGRRQIEGLLNQFVIISLSLHISISYWFCISGEHWLKHT